jgi:hypothetical protein
MNPYMKRILLLSVTLAGSLLANSQNCSDIFISEYVEGSNNNKAIELYNPTNQPIVLDGHYKMGRDRDGAGVPMLMAITGTIPAHDVRVFALDKRNPNGTGTEIPLDVDLEAAADTFLNPVYDWNGTGSGQTYSPMYFNGDDAFVLVKDDVTILDIVGRIGEDPGSGWWVPGDPNTAWWTVDNTLIRKFNVQHGVLSNPTAFDPSLEWDSLPVNTFDSLGHHMCSCGFVNVSEILEREFSIFPNPVSQGQFAVKSAHAMAGYSLMSADGRLIEKQKISGQFHTNIALPAADQGIYFIEIEYIDGRRSTQKLISR